jgi:hypothetical protein
MSIRMYESEGYPKLVNRADAQVVAVLFRDSLESLDANFEGPPAMIRRFDNLVEFAVGRVVRTWYNEERIMSDVWDYVTRATVVKDDGTYETINLGTLSMGPYTHGISLRIGAETDAPPALIEMHKAYLHMVELDMEVKEKERLKAFQQELVAKQAATPAKGKTLKVVRGRKVPIGLEGVCMWYGETKYGYRVGITVKDQKDPVWVDARNVEVVRT